jgi:hypothetical protein
MQQHVYCLGYVSLVLVMYSLSGLVLYAAAYSLKMVNYDRNMSEFFYKLFLTKVIVLKFWGVKNLKS